MSLTCADLNLTLGGGTPGVNADPPAGLRKINHAQAL